MVYDITLEGYKDTIPAGDEMIVTIANLPKGLTGVYIFFVDDDGNTVDMNATYDPVTGTATFKTNHFSTYAVSFNGAIKVYTEEDFGAVKTSASGLNYRGLLKDKTYILMNDVTAARIMLFDDGVTIDLNGYTLTASATYWSNYSNVAKTTINVIDSSDAKTGKIINSKNYLFDLSKNETVINFDETISLVSTAFGATLFRISNGCTLTVNNAKAQGQFYLAQPYGGTTHVVFNNCSAIGDSSSGIIAQHGYASAAITTEFNNCEFTCTGSPYSTYVVMAQDGYGNVTEKFVIFNNTALNGTIQVRQNVVFDGCAITGKVDRYGQGTVTYKNGTTLNGVEQPNT